MKRELRLDSNRPLAFDSQAMGLLSRFEKKPAGTPGMQRGTAPQRAAAGATAPLGELWRKAAVSTYVAGDDTHAVYFRDRLPVILPSFAVDFALGCTEFGPLAKHLQEHADLHNWSSLQVASLQSWLPKMIEAGVLVSGDSLRSACAAIRDPANLPPKISAIGYPTGGNRVGMLARALSSFAANTRDYGRSVDFLVVDSSPLAEQRALFREKSRELSHRHGVRILYSGEEEKRRYAEALIRKSGCRRETVEFALFDVHNAGFACGANRNAIQLHQIDQMFATMDDDVICELAAPPDTEVKLALFSHADPSDRWVFPDRKRALESVRFESRDYLGEHEALLGRDLGELLPAELTLDQIDLSKLGDDFLRRIEAGAARVRTTYCGYVGDPGIPTSLFFLYQQGKNRERLTLSEEWYRAAMENRSTLVLPATRAVGNWSIAPGVAMGLDNRDILPPFFPVLHGEDVTFGAACAKCCRGGVSGYLPLAVHHDSSTGKPTLMPGDLSADSRAVVFEFTQVLRVIIDHQRVPETADTRGRMMALGRQLSESAAWSRKDFREMIRTSVLHHESTKMMHLEQLLRNETGAPDYWRNDVRHFIDHTHEALTHEDFDIPYELKAHRTDEENRELMQRLIASYGALLQEWPAMVDAARELQMDETTPFIDAASA